MIRSAVEGREIPCTDAGCQMVQSFVFTLSLPCGIWATSQMGDTVSRGLCGFLSFQCRVFTVPRRLSVASVAIADPNSKPLVRQSGET